MADDAAYGQTPPNPFSFALSRHVLSHPLLPEVHNVHKGGVPMLNPGKPETSSGPHGGWARRHKGRRLHNCAR